MFLVAEEPVGEQTEHYAWRGEYRGGRVYVKGRGSRFDAEFSRASDDPRNEPHIFIRASRTTVAQALHAIKCGADWEMWQREHRGSPDRQVHQRALEAITYHLGREGRITLSRGWAALAVADSVTALLANNADDRVPAWWRQQTMQDQIRFLRDVWSCMSDAQDRDDADRPAETPKKQDKKRSKKRSLRERLYHPPGPRQSRSQDDPVPERPFGHCKRCKVCLAFDVAEGCCTVCGGPLTPNPPITWKPTAAARKVAKQALEKRRKLSPSRRGGLTRGEAAEQGITSGVEQARRIAAGKTMDAMQIHRFFSRFKGIRAEALAKGKRWEDSKVLQAWDLWGGDPARKAVSRLAAARPNPEEWYQERLGDWHLSLYPWGISAWRFELYNEKTDEERVGSEPTRSRALAAARRIAMRMRARDNPKKRKVKKKPKRRDRAEALRRLMRL